MKFTSKRIFIGFWALSLVSHSLLLVLTTNSVIEFLTGLFLWCKDHNIELVTVALIANLVFLRNMREAQPLIRLLQLLLEKTTYVYAALAFCRRFFSFALLCGSCLPIQSIVGDFLLYRSEGLEVAGSRNSVSLLTEISSFESLAICLALISLWLIISVLVQLVDKLFIRYLSCKWNVFTNFDELHQLITLQLYIGNHELADELSLVLLNSANNLSGSCIQIPQPMCATIVDGSTT